MFVDSTWLIIIAFAIVFGFLGLQASMGFSSGKLFGSKDGMCPACKLAVPLDAIKCRHCGADLKDVSAIDLRKFWRDERKKSPVAKRARTLFIIAMIFNLAFIGMSFFAPFSYAYYSAMVLPLLFLILAMPSELRFQREAKAALERLREGTPSTGTAGPVEIMTSGGAAAKIVELKSLLDNGLISEEDFEAAKKKALDI